ncbi:putative transposase [Ereboglobus sp. PH5-10]|uniref:IS200/IS605 family transposase n=1 Tax=Ereboglobus sp. PH5-10 TaxID=2940629 RepID=UPI002406C6AD|nr:IS200/IS605 family transposase [Ereboglobus sp. PH5-10]MDF9827736.1 putative transposase [Ereboglobus sp. PH5-10]
MSQSFSATYPHLVFSTKDRAPLLRDKGARAEIHAYLGGISKQLDCVPLITGGVEDHAHMLAQLARTMTIADWVKELKRVSTLWIKERFPALHDFSWQSGYGVFSVSQSNTGAVEEYIANQEAHHRKTTFQEEYRALLQKHKIEWDERYVWE